MNPKRILFSMAAGLFVFLSAPSCQRDQNCCGKDSTLVTSLEVANYYQDRRLTSSHIEISYTNDGHLLKFQEDFTRYNETLHESHRTFLSVFDYSGRQCVKTRVEEDGQYAQTYLFNADGTLSEIISEKGESTMFSYANGQLVSMDNIRYVWNQGNIVSIQRADETFPVEYYDVPNPFLGGVDWVIDIGTLLPGDPFGYGFAGKQNANLIKSVKVGENEYQWSYEFDGKGRIKHYKQSFYEKDDSAPLIQEVTLHYCD